MEKKQTNFVDKNLGHDDTVVHEKASVIMIIKHKNISVWITFYLYCLCWVSLLLGGRKHDNLSLYDLAPKLNLKGTGKAPVLHTFLAFSSPPQCNVS